MNGKAAVGTGNAEFISRLQNARFEGVTPVDLGEVVRKLNVIGREIDTCAPIGQPRVPAEGDRRQAARILHRHCRDQSPRLEIEVLALTGLDVIAIGDTEFVDGRGAERVGFRNATGPVFIAEVGIISVIRRGISSRLKPVITKRKAEEAVHSVLLGYLPIHARFQVTLREAVRDRSLIVGPSVRQACGVG